MTTLGPNLERAMEGIDASRRLGRILRLVGGALPRGARVLVIPASVVQTPLPGK